MWEAAQKRDPVYLVQLSPAHRAFLESVAKKFHSFTVWTPNRQIVYFNPPFSQLDGAAAN